MAKLPEAKNEKSKFVFNSDTYEVIAGKLPTRSGQLWKGEDHHGCPMEFSGDDTGDPTPYWGWSS